LASLGHPCKFQQLSRLGSVTARQSSSGRQPNFAALNRGRHVYSARRPSRWALAHISSIFGDGNPFRRRGRYRVSYIRRCSSRKRPVHQTRNVVLRFFVARKARSATLCRTAMMLSSDETCGDVLSRETDRRGWMLLFKATRQGDASINEVKRRPGQHVTTPVDDNNPASQ